MGETDGRDDALDVVTRRLVSDEHDPMVDAMCAAVFDEHPVYEGMRDKEGFRAGVSRLVHLFCATVAGRRPMSADERSLLHVIGSQRARQGVQKQEVVGGLKTAVREAWDVFTRMLAEHCGSAQELQSLTTVLFRHVDTFVDDAVEALLAGFRAEAEQPLPGRVRVQAMVLDRLLEPGWENEQHYEFARSQGVRVLPPLAVFAVAGSPETVGTVLRRAAKEIVEHMPDVVEGPLRVTGAPHVVLLLNHADDEHLQRLGQVARAVSRQLAVVVVIPGAVERPEFLAQAYDSLRANVAFAPLARPHGGLVSMDELGTYALYSRLPPDQRTDYALRVLDGVLRLGAGRRNTLLDAFDAWLRAGGDSRAAGELLRGVTAATVRYRLRKLEEHTGKRLGDPNDLCALVMAYRLYRGWVGPLAHNAS
jgi:hypothetical protein